MSDPNRRLNFDGNFEDEAGGSFYIESEGRRIAGPFGAASYAQTVRDRMRDEWPDPKIDYEP